MRRHSLGFVVGIAATIAGFVLPATPAVAATYHITEYPIPTASSDPMDIAAGPDGRIWFTEENKQTIGALNPADGHITEYPVIDTAYNHMANIAAGPDGAMWFTEYKDVSGGPSMIGRISVTGAVRTYRVPGILAVGITAGPDGNIWFVGSGTNGNDFVGRITPAGVITTFKVPSRYAAPRSIAAGPDGNLWFTERRNPAAIGRITPAGVITEFPVSTDGNMLSICAGPDGNMWFTETLMRIGRITTSGAVTEFPVAGQTRGIVAGSDGALWVAIWTTNKPPASSYRIRRYDTNGNQLTSLPIPTPTSLPENLTVGRDGNTWFTEGYGNKIGQVRPVLPGNESHVLKLPSRFMPGVTLTRLGETVHWTFNDPAPVSIVDRSGLDLFSSPLQQPGTTYQHVFDLAGTWPYRNGTDPTQTGEIRTSLRIRPRTATVSQPTEVRWATGGLPAGTVADIQIQRPGSSSFVAWRTGVTTSADSFVADGGPGTYRFIARIRNPSTGTASGYSSGTGFEATAAG